MGRAPPLVRCSPTVACLHSSNYICSQVGRVLVPCALGRLAATAYIPLAAAVGSVGLVDINARILRISDMPRNWGISLLPVISHKSTSLNNTRNILR